jgi:hypothetical protein
LENAKQATGHKPSAVKLRHLKGQDMAGEKKSAMRDFWKNVVGPGDPLDKAVEYGQKALDYALDAKHDAVQSVVDTATENGVISKETAQEAMNAENFSEGVVKAGGKAAAGAAKILNASRNPVDLAKYAAGEVKDKAQGVENAYTNAGGGTAGAKAAALAAYGMVNPGIGIGEQLGDAINTGDYKKAGEAVGTAAILVAGTFLGGEGEAAESGELESQLPKAPEEPVAGPLRRAPVEKPAIPDDELPETQDRPVVPDEQLPETQDRPVVPDEQLPETQDRPVVPDEQLPETQDRPVVPDEQLPETLPRPQVANPRAQSPKDFSADPASPDSSVPSESIPEVPSFPSEAPGPPTLRSPTFESPASPDSSSPSEPIPEVPSFPAEVPNPEIAPDTVDSPPPVHEPFEETPSFQQAPDTTESPPPVHEPFEEAPSFEKAPDTTESPPPVHEPFEEAPSFEKAPDTLQDPPAQAPKDFSGFESPPDAVAQDPEFPATERAPVDSEAPPGTNNPPVVPESQPFGEPEVTGPEEPAEPAEPREPSPETLRVPDFEQSPAPPEEAPNIQVQDPEVTGPAEPAEPGDPMETGPETLQSPEFSEEPVEPGGTPSPEAPPNIEVQNPDAPMPKQSPIPDPDEDLDGYVKRTEEEGPVEHPVMPSVENPVIPSTEEAPAPPQAADSLPSSAPEPEPVARQPEEVES